MRDFDRRAFEAGTSRSAARSSIIFDSPSEHGAGYVIEYSAELGAPLQNLPRFREGLVATAVG